MSSILNIYNSKINQFNTYGENLSAQLYVF